MCRQNGKNLGETTLRKATTLVWPSTWAFTQYMTKKFKVYMYISQSILTDLNASNMANSPSSANFIGL